MDLFTKITKGEKILIGMIHCLPLPGTYGATATIDHVIERAVSDAKCIEECGYDAIMVENEDLCNAPRMSKVQFAGISMVTRAVREAVSIPIGLSCGCLSYEEALSIARITGGSFVRTPIFVDTVMNYHGIIEPCSVKVIQYRNQIQADNVKILADIQVKHYHMVNPSIDITESARWAVRQGADAVIVTGNGTGMETSIDDLKRVKKCVPIPVVVGSGITADNIKQQLEIADILIVGTALRKEGKLSEPVDREKAEQIIQSGRSC